MNSHLPLIVQSDFTLLLEAAHPGAMECRRHVSRFAELEKSPEHIHTFRLSPLSLWNAAAGGVEADWIIAKLQEFSKFGVPPAVKKFIFDHIRNFGLLVLKPFDENFHLLEFTDRARDNFIFEEITGHRLFQKFIQGEPGQDKFLVSIYDRGAIKSTLIQLGYPVRDEVGHRTGDPHPLALRTALKFSGKPFALRDYQNNAVTTFCGGLTDSGVIVLPCGAGKTVIGLAVMARQKQKTLILGTNILAVRQWISEILDKTDCREEDIGEYSGEHKLVKPITVATYQILVQFNKKDRHYPHFNLLTGHNWGLIIYDEVHLLPAPIFQITSSIQGTLRLGLTATLIREDGRERDVFSLIGPKKFEIPWKDLEKLRWIASAVCHEIRTPLPRPQRLEYARADRKLKFRIASENPDKYEKIRQLLDNHRQDQVLIIGQYLSQLDEVAKIFELPLVTGAKKNREREELFDLFRQGKLKALVVSKIANFAIDLPDANVAIQISGTYGSRQEEAQRLGRILRPKDCPAHFYTLITKDSVEQDFATKRQLFLTEQGYSYEIIDCS